MSRWSLMVSSNLLSRATSLIAGEIGIGAAVDGGQAGIAVPTFRPVNTAWIGKSQGAVPPILRGTLGAGWAHLPCELEAGWPCFLPHRPLVLTQRSSVENGQQHHGH